MNRLAQLTATVGGVGYLRPAPGTWGIRRRGCR